jgi:hypothetical protein
MALLRNNLWWWVQLESKISLKKVEKMKDSHTQKNTNTAVMMRETFGRELYRARHI